MKNDLSKAKDVELIVKLENLILEKGSMLGKNNLCNDYFAEVIFKIDEVEGEIVRRMEGRAKDEI